MHRPPEVLAKGFTRYQTWINLRIPKNLKYKYYAAPRGSILFNVKAKSNAHIALTTELQDEGPMYELIVGGWTNTATAIRKNRTRPDKTHVETPNILHKDEMRCFWLSWHMGVILFGRKGSKIPIATWTDPMPFRIFFIGFASGWGSVALWQFEDLETDGHLCPYLFYPVRNGSIKFQVRAEMSAWIALTTHPEVSSNMYEFTIGELYNYKSYAKYKGSRIAEMITPDILDEYSFIGFRIDISKNILTFECDDYDVTTIFKFPLNEECPVLYIGIRTAKHTRGLWKIEAVPGYNANACNAAKSGIWVDASDGLVPPGAVIEGEHENEEPVYLARVIHGDNVIPCKLLASQGCVVISWAGREYRENHYQVLVRNTITWVTTSFQNIPLGAVPGEVTKDGVASYIGRISNSDGTNTIGRVPYPEGSCYVMLRGEEKQYTHYDILMS